MFLATFIGGILALGVLYLSFNSMFPKTPGKKQTISIREIFRKYPLFGTVNLLVLYAGFLFLPGLIVLPLFFIIEIIPLIVWIFIEFLLKIIEMPILYMIILLRS